MHNYFPLKLIRKYLLRYNNILYITLADFIRRSDIDFLYINGSGYQCQEWMRTWQTQLITELDHICWIENGNDKKWWAAILIVYSFVCIHIKMEWNKAICIFSLVDECLRIWYHHSKKKFKVIYNVWSYQSGN